MVHQGTQLLRIKLTLLWGILVILYSVFEPATQLNTHVAVINAPKIGLEDVEAKRPPWKPTEAHFTRKPIEQVTTENPMQDLSCMPPAIEQFPRPLIGPSARKHGALILHVLVCVYSFVGLAIVCDDYFITSLDRICEVLKLSPDVAGATFMAAGSSAPELATVIIAVFFAKDDIGVSGVIGSAVFNVMFVIGICAVLAGTVTYLNWWPMCRDSFFYLVSIMAMLIVMYDHKITWVESTSMLILYVIYGVVLAYNERIEAWAQTWPVPCKRNEFDTTSNRVTAAHVTVDCNTCQLTGGAFVYANHVTYRSMEDDGDGERARSQSPGKPTHYQAKETSNPQVSPLERPDTDNFFTFLKWLLIYPIHYTSLATMPDCRRERYTNWYPYVFLISLAWISSYSYIMVWMITIIGNTLGIPDTVMGLTFVAAGVSVPDALSSLAVVKDGYGDMAVSNAVGSNVFDILICLGLPWFLKTSIINPGSYVRVYSKGLIYSTLTLLSTVFFLIGITHTNGWRMDRRYGITLILWYLFFICFASLYELNVFGYMNPPGCPSEY